MAARLPFLFTVAIILQIHATSAEITSYNDAACHKNKKLPREAPDNYQDCNTTEALEGNNTKCCKLNGEFQCCGEGNNQKMLIIGFAIAGSTLALAVTCYLVFWVDLRNVPCLAHCLPKCWDDVHGKQKEEDDATAFADLSKSSRSLEQRAPPMHGHLSMPEEYRKEPVAAWW